MRHDLSAYGCTAGCTSRAGPDSQSEPSKSKELAHELRLDTSLEVQLEGERHPAMLPYMELGAED